MTPIFKAAGSGRNRLRCGRTKSLAQFTLRASLLHPCGDQFLLNRITPLFQQFKLPDIRATIGQGRCERTQKHERHYGRQKAYGRAEMYQLRVSHNSDVGCRRWLRIKFRAYLPKLSTDCNAIFLGNCLRHKQFHLFEAGIQASDKPLGDVVKVVFTKHLLQRRKTRKAPFGNATGQFRHYFPISPPASRHLDAVNQRRIKCANERENRATTADGNFCRRHSQ